jgi:ABC-type nitrate/sulfonate/bicarbonate transport system substrate-binding protein
VGITVGSHANDDLVARVTARLAKAYYLSNEQVKEVAQALIQSLADDYPEADVLKLLKRFRGR